jgi:hypothetical protein
MIQKEHAYEDVYFLNTKDGTVGIGEMFNWIIKL